MVQELYKNWPEGKLDKMTKRDGKKESEKKEGENALIEGYMT